MRRVDVLAHGAEAPSAWVRRWSHLVPAGARVLDLACGAGRHVRWFAGRGARVTGIDRDAAAVEPLRGLAEIVVADLESGPWPLAGRRFDAVIVTNYLWRPRYAELLASVAAGGLLIHETFALGHETIGRPARADFLLRPGELLGAVAPLRVVAYEDGYEPPDHAVAAGSGTIDPDPTTDPSGTVRGSETVDAGRPPAATGRFVQRIVAVRDLPTDPATPPRHPLR